MSEDGLTGYELSSYEREIVEDDREEWHRTSSTGRWIRGYLTHDEEADYISSMYRRYKRFVEHFLSFDPPSYQSFSRYMRELRRKDLVIHVYTEQADGPDFLANRKYYKINQETKEILGAEQWREEFDNPFNND